jgi:osmoprotectant transport system ATP-binding protein
LITFDSVTKRYPDGTLALEELNLELRAGEITVFVGPSGCGKTTSLRMINRMIEPTSGHVIVDGKDVMKQDPSVLRRSIGYVIQQAGLFPHRTIVDNVATVPLLLGRSKKESRAKALELLETVGLAREVGRRYPSQLSGGQQQRVGVARALAADPPLMLMDEPFSAVDPIVREELQREFLRLQSELGKTIAFVTHDIDEAIKIGDRIAIFKEGGKLVQVDTPAQLLANPVDEFVADFVGRDRGYRGLSFVSSSDVPVEPLSPDEPVERMGALLVRDPAGRPVGWQRGSGPRSTLPLGGTFGGKDSLRTVTDLAIVSPVGVAVRVDANGVADGLVALDSIASHITRHQAAAASSVEVPT